MWKAILFAALVLASVTLALAAAPPGAINYQGVLRDAGDNPLDGNHDMQFHFMDADAGGNALLTDEHLALGTGAVTVSGGLFNVEIGSGTLVDPGSGYTSLAEVFQHHTDVWVEITVGVETLTPRVKVAAAAYALNADHLGGMAAGDFLDTSAVAQVKTGNLTVGDLTVSGGDILLPGGGEIEGNSTTTTLHGNSDSDRLFLFAGTDASSGGIRAFGNGIFYLDGAIGYFSFRDQSVSPSIETAKLTAGGDFQIDGDLTVDGSSIFLGPSAGEIRADSSATYLSNADDTDDLRLYAGNSLDDGGIVIFGDSNMSFNSGNGYFFFRDATSGIVLAGLDPGGNLQVDGDLDLGGSLDVSGGAVTLDDETIVTSWGNPATLTFDGTNLDLILGGSGADEVIVPGVLTVSGLKNFFQNHPGDPGKSIVYTALEGDEAGTYTRGSARLEGGVARVALGETFAWTTNPEIGLTAQVTPRAETALFVESVTTAELVVRSVDPGAPDVAFDYIVHGLRIGYEAYDVVREKIMASDVPSDAYYSALYEGREDLRRYSALDRFQRMAGVRAQTVDSGAARTLREAIGERHAIADIPTEPTEEGPLGEYGPATPDSGSEPPGEETNAGFIENLLEPTRTVVGIEPTALEGDDASRPARAALAPVEWFPVSESVEAGDVLAIDLDRPGWFRKAAGASDPAVLGIVASVAIAASESMSEIASGDSPRDVAEVPIAISGTVSCKVDAGFGEIRPGDLLTSSPTPGHAMRAATIVPGTVVGKALEGLDVGTGTIRVLVMSR